MPMTTTTETTQTKIKLEYSSFQLNRYLSNSILNSGTRLQPTKVDSFIHVRTEPSLLDNVDPYISEVPEFISSISWNITEKSKLPPSDVKNAKTCYVELYSLEKKKHCIPDRNYWEQYFILGPLDMVAPNGNLYLVPDMNNSDVISIQLQDKEVRNPLLFGYGIVFTVEVDDKKNVNYCRIDPIANIRSRPAS